MTVCPVLIGGAWRAANSSGTFQSENPAKCEPLKDRYPVSTWADCQAALESACQASLQLGDGAEESLAQFLELYAQKIEAGAQPLVEMAHAETALAASPRLADVELPRTTSQLRQAAAAAREGSWRRATIDSKANIRSYYAAIGPVCVFGPNNFPFAFNSIAGGDFAAAIATGCPVIAKANSSHPGTTRLLGELAQQAADEAGLPRGTVQLLYRLSHDDGERLVADPRVGATAYTGSRSAGLKLKAAAGRAGKPIYLELSSINPVVILPGALKERGEQIAGEFAGSCLMGAGQFCTNPGLVVLLDTPESQQFVAEIASRFQAAPPGTLLSKGVASSLEKSVEQLRAAGAEVVAGGSMGGGNGYSYANTLLRTDGEHFLSQAESLQTEAFGNASLVVVARNAEQAADILDHLEGNLTGCVYSDSQGSDEDLYRQLEPRLRRRVGRLLNDKMPTGVAVSAAMNHGGPYPATGHAGFTAVGIPASLTRFGKLECYDNVRPQRLPPALGDESPNSKMWRLVDGAWKQG
jgi:NADP-dependent aldehyde dehydrogenase